MTVQLLYVEGSETAAKRFVNLARLRRRARWHVNRVNDAYEAIDYLSGFQNFADRVRFPLPHMVWLSLSARTRNGLDLLAWLRGASRFRRLRVIVATRAATNIEQVSACELAPGAWFAHTSDYHDVLGSLENLVVGPWPTALRAGESQTNHVCHEPACNCSLDWTSAVRYAA